MVGKYVDLTESYKSLTEALRHAGIHTDSRVNIEYIDSEADRARRHAPTLDDVDAILVPGGFGKRGVEGKIAAIRYARENGDAVPRHLPRHAARGDRVRAQRRAGWSGANCTEFDPDTPHPVVALITEWQNRDGRVERRDENSDLGGTMRLGAQTCPVEPGTLAAAIYGAEVTERHRHRYEVNNHYRAAARGGRPAWSRPARRPRTCARSWSCRAAHPWFVGVQFHPEFTSTPRDGHPLFTRVRRGRAGARRAPEQRSRPAQGRSARHGSWRAQHASMKLRVSSRPRPAAVPDRRALRDRVARAGDRHRRHAEGDHCARSASRSSTSRRFDKANRSSGKIVPRPGHGRRACEILADVKRAVGVPVLTDVHEDDEIRPVAAVVDVLQTPAFLCRQTDFIRAVARSGQAGQHQEGPVPRAAAT